MTDQFFTKSDIVSELPTTQYMAMVSNQLDLLREYRASMTRVLMSGKINSQYSAITKEIYRLNDEYMALYRKLKLTNRSIIRPASVEVGDGC
ncbi:MAG: hypothetical protein BWY67_00737 [Bacteroidetes bacterium ADurb.Bin397]|jgi:hypothetical protein|nr:MAG: hypothetical protein BWY67_00737 [Bacteroidetes bacterium ADurb.Bin397]